jgi:hypothetical protein
VDTVRHNGERHTSYIVGVIIRFADAAIQGIAIRD